MTLNSEFAQTLQESRANGLSPSLMTQPAERFPASNGVSADAAEFDTQAMAQGIEGEIRSQTDDTSLPASGIHLPPRVTGFQTSFSTLGQVASELQRHVQIDAIDAFDETASSLPLDQVDLSNADLREGLPAQPVTISASSLAQQGTLDDELPAVHQDWRLNSAAVNWEEHSKSNGTGEVEIQSGSNKPAEQAGGTGTQSQAPGVAPRIPTMSRGQSSEFTTPGRPENASMLLTGHLRTPTTNTLGVTVGLPQVDLSRLAMDVDGRRLERSTPVNAALAAQRPTVANQVRANGEPQTGLQSQPPDMSGALVTNRNTAESALRSPTPATSSGFNPAAMNIISGIHAPVPGQVLSGRLDAGLPPALESATTALDLQPKLASEKAEQPIKPAFKPASLKQPVAELQSIERNYLSLAAARGTKSEIDPAIESLLGQTRQSFAQSTAANNHAAPLNPMMAAWASREAGVDNKTNTDVSLTLAPLGLKTDGGNGEKFTSSQASAGLSATAMNKALGENVSDQLMRAVSRQALTSGRFTLQLNPRELGAVDIEFSTERGELQLAVIVRESATRELVENNLARLRQTLQEAGVSLGELDVRQEQQQDRQSTTEQHQSQVASQSTAALDHESQAAPAAAGSSERLFDIYV